MIAILEKNKNVSLKQKQAVLHETHAGLLSMYDDAGKEILLKPYLCFPWTSPMKFVSLRDEEGHERLLVRSLEDLDDSSRNCLEKALLAVGFVFEITNIQAIVQDFELRNWKVETRQGIRFFQTKLNTWPRALEKGGFLIRTIEDDLFYIPDPYKLDHKSQKLLWAFVD